MQHADLPLGVAEDDRLRDGERVVQVAQRVKLPLLSLHGHKKLLDALQRQLVTETHNNQCCQGPRGKAHNLF